MAELRKNIRKFEQKADIVKQAPRDGEGYHGERRLLEKSDGLYEYVNFNGKWYYVKFTRV